MNSIPTFFLIISLSLTFILFLIHFELARNPKIDRKLTFDLILVLMIFGFLGARVTHIFYEEFNFYQSFPLEVFKFWKGGFVFYGGFTFAALAAVIFLKNKKQNFWFWADFLTPYISLSYTLGRIGCFFEGCCYGHYCDLPWSVTGRHPTQLYMAFGEALIMTTLILWRRHKTKIFLQEGGFFLTWLMAHATVRFIIEFYRADDRGLLIATLSISQWISLLIFGLAFGFIANRQIRKNTLDTP